jgi:hypothetical protein
MYFVVEGFSRRIFKLRHYPGRVSAVLSRGELLLSGHSRFLTGKERR